MRAEFRPKLLARWSALTIAIVSVLAKAETLKVLTYESMTGKESLGEFIEQEFPTVCNDCKVKFIVVHENSGLLGRLRSNRRTRKDQNVDVVLGLDGLLYQTALQEKLIRVGKVLDKSPYAIVVDTKKIPKTNWPKTWKELNLGLKGKLLIEDPRLSQVGVGWLRAVFEMKLIDNKEAKALTARIFPSWSSAYSAFMAGEGSAVWTYLSSEAFHRCEAERKHDTSSPRYLALPLEEGYPIQEEWVAELTNPAPHPSARKFVDFVQSRKVQDQIPLRNWMYPSNEEVPLPPCFKAVAQVKTWKADKVIEPKNLRAWMDLWSL